MVSSGRSGCPLRQPTFARPYDSTPFRSQVRSDLNAVIARTAPAVLVLLADDVPRSEAVIVAALADRHPKDEVKHTLMRLAVLKQLSETGGRYTLPAGEAE